MTEDCAERFDLEFFHFVLVYKLVRRKGLIKKIRSNGEGKKIIISRSPSHIEEMVNNDKY